MAANVACVPLVIRMCTRAVATCISILLNAMAHHLPLSKVCGWLNIVYLLPHLNFAVYSDIVWKACPLSLYPPVSNTTSKNQN